MKQKYDNNYQWLYQHMQHHLGITEKQTPDEDSKDHMDREHDGINVDSEVIISEYRLLYLKYKEQINLYKEAIANLSLKQIINNEEEAWVQHRMQQENKDQEVLRNQSTTSKDNVNLTSEAAKIISNVRAYEFEEEINQLSLQLKDKIKQLRKDYKDLKIFQNEADIQSAREKLLIFVRKLISDTNSLIATIKRNFDKNMAAMEENRKEQLFDAIEADK